MRLLFTSLILACTAVSACQAAPAARDAASTLDALQRLSAASACQSAQQCKTVAIGARACGGPEAYLAYSTSTLDEAKALAARHAAARRAENAATPELRSNCRMVSDPGAQCVAGRCTAGGASPTE